MIKMINLLPFRACNFVGGQEGYAARKAQLARPPRSGSQIPRTHDDVYQWLHRYSLGHSKYFVTDWYLECRMNWWHVVCLFHCLYRGRQFRGGMEKFNKKKAMAERPWAADFPLPRAWRQPSVRPWNTRLHATCFKLVDTFSPSCHL